MILWLILNARIQSGDIMVTLDRWSVYSLSRWVHTLDHVWAWFSTISFKHVSTKVGNVLDADISEVEVENVISRLVNGKGPGWDGLKNEFLKKYNTNLKRSFAILFQNVWSTGHMPQSSKIGLIKLLPNHLQCFLLNGGIYLWWEESIRFSQRFWLIDYI